jgi:cyanate permease
LTPVGHQDASNLHNHSSDEPPPNWPQLALGWFLYFSFGMVVSSLVPIVTLLRQDLSLSYTEIGIVLGAWQFVYIGAAAPAGVLIDRIGPKRALAIGALVIAVSALLRSLADGFWLLFAAVALFGLGGPVISIGLPKLIADWFTGAHRGLASGVYMTGSATGSVLVLALTHSLVLPLVGSWRGALVVYGIVAALSAGLWLIFGRDSPESISARREGKKREEGSYRAVIFHPAVVVVVIVGFSGFLANHGLRNWLPQVLEAAGESPVRAGWISALPALTGIFGSIFILRLASHSAANRKPVTIALLLICGAGIAAIMFTEGWLLIAIIAVEGFCAAAVTPLMLNTLMETPRVGAKHLGAAAGLFFAVGEVGGTLGPVLLGVTADLTGSFTTGILILAGVMWIMVLPAFRIGGPGRPEHAGANHPT